jgi:hypothetical protein
MSSENKSQPKSIYGKPIRIKHEHMPTLKILAEKKQWSITQVVNDLLKRTLKKYEQVN